MRLLNCIFFMAFSLPWILNGQLYHCGPVFVNTDYKNISYSTYNENSNLYKLENFSDVDNSQPEKLIQSMISATSLEWYNFNRKNKVKSTSQDFVYISNIKPEEHYVTIDAKLEYVHEGKQFALIKHTIHSLDKSVTMAVECERIDGRWFINDRTTNHILKSLFVVLKKEHLSNIFLGVGDNPLINDLLKKSKNKSKANSSIDIDLFLDLLEKESRQKNPSFINLLDPNSPFKIQQH